MAQNVTIAGAQYSDVPAIDVPKTGGGTARFADVSGVTATAPDVAQGKVFVDSSGAEITGTASGDVTLTISDEYIRSTSLTNRTFSLQGLYLPNVKKVVIDFPRTIYSSGQIRLDTVGPEEYVVRFNDATATLNYLFFPEYLETHRNETLKKVTIDFDTMNVVTWQYTFRQLYALRIIDGHPLDLTSWNGSHQPFYNMLYCPLNDVRFVPSSIKHTFSIGTGIAAGSTQLLPNPHLTAASLISVANGLDASVSGMQLTNTASTVHSYQQDMIAILGYNNNGTFVADASGTLNLADFITNVKGWTLA